MKLRNYFEYRKSVLLWSRKYPIAERCKVIRDYLSLYNSKGLRMDEYYDFEFEKRSEAFRDSFLGVREQRYYLEQLNPFKYFIFARNKFAAHKFFENTGIRTSELYCYFEPCGNVENSSEIATSVADVVRILKLKGVSQCVIKSTEDSHGDNVIVVKEIRYFENDCELLLFNGATEKLSDVLSNHPRIFESVIKQTKQFAGFNESSVNTVRFMTTMYPDGTAKVIPSWMKFGRIGRCVDNAGSGGNVDAAIDLETGRIYNVVEFNGWRKVRKIEKHPDSGVQLEGVIIENWESIKAEVIKFQQAFPWCKAAGWDIAITDDGPVVIEVNDMWDRTGQYFISKGWRDEIRDCYKAWKDAGYKVYRGRLENDFSKAKCEKIFKI